MTAAHRLPRVWAVAGTALLVIGLAEGAVRLGEHRLPEPDEWYLEMAQARIAHAEALAAWGIESDVLFVGTSMVFRGVSVEEVERRMPTVDQARNAALLAAQTPVVERWLLEEMVPRVRPRLVVWGVSSIDFNANRPEPVIERYESARAVRPGWVGAVDRFLAGVSAVSHHRGTLRDPAGVGLLVGLGDPQGGGVRIPDDPDRLMAPRNDREGTGGRTPQTAAQVRDALSDWVFGHREADAYRSTIRALQDRGIGVVVVVMPVPTGYLALHPDGAADYREFLTKLEAETSALGVPLLDYSGALADDAFYDYTHLNGVGAETFSTMLADGLTGLGW